jgi:phosphotriesterase-related protein
MAVMTVNGKINADKLGITYLHEHLFMDLSKHWNSKFTDKDRLDEKIKLSNVGLLNVNPFLIRDNLILNDSEVLLKELMEFKKAGGILL